MEAIYSACMRTQSAFKSGSGDACHSPEAYDCQLPCPTEQTCGLLRDKTLARTRLAR